MKKIKAGINVEVTEDKQLDRTLTFVGSNELIDRDNEVIRADGWDLKNYRKNPVILFAHDYRSPAVGKALKVWAEKDRLKFKVQFPEMEEYGFADTLYKLYKGGFMKAVSVGFMPREWEWGKEEDGPRRIFTQQELLELSLVPVPANPDAVMTSAGMKGAQERGIVDDLELKELIHMLETAEKAREGVESGPDGEEKAEGDDIGEEKEEDATVGESGGRATKKHLCRECGKEIPDLCPACAATKEPTYIDILLQDLRTEKGSQEESHEGVIDDTINTLKTMKEDSHGK